VWVLGINWKRHDSAAAIVDGDGRVWALAEEERFTRVKHAWGTWPALATAYCLRTAGITWRDLDAVAVGWDLPAMEAWGDDETASLYEALFGPDGAGARRPELVFVPHHLAHAHSTFHASGFDRAGVLVVDGSGETLATSIYSAGRGSGIALQRGWPRGYSLGAMYEGATRLLGFGSLDAGKTMGLAPYCPSGTEAELPFPDVTGDVEWTTAHGLGADESASHLEFTGRWRRLLARSIGAVTRPADRLDEDPVARRVAGSAQRVVEASMRALHAESVRLSGHEQVCLAGGVALNCVANGQLPEPIYVPPYPHDAGVALGAAWSICPPARAGLLESPYLGSAIAGEGEARRLRDDGCAVSELALQAVVELLLDGAIGAIAEGRAEVGPRALGHRSIVAVPRPAAVRDRINRLKGREPWRPLAPVTLPEYAGRLWPSQGLRELYMVGTAIGTDHAREVMPAALHVDGSTRPQVLPPGQAPVLEGLLRALADAGLPPVLVNTSFNGPGEPIVDSAADATSGFQRLGLDFLVLGDQLVQRRRAPLARAGLDV
jgi:carbamoyltransferase